MKPNLELAFLIRQMIEFCKATASSSIANKMLLKNLFLWITRWPKSLSLSMETLLFKG